jgi:hypothetical protein
MAGIATEMYTHLHFRLVGALGTFDFNIAIVRAARPQYEADHAAISDACRANYGRSVCVEAMVTDPARGTTLRFADIG